MTTRIIAHKLKKTLGDSEPSTFCRTELNDPNSSGAVSLIKGARKGVRKSSASAIFALDEAGRPKVFQQLLLDYLQANTDESFLAMSTAAMDTLLGQIRLKTAATGGNVIFIHYQNDSGGVAADEEFLLVALVNEEDTPAFDPEMNVIESTVLDLDNLKHGARVRLSWIGDNKDGVVSLLTRRGSAETAGYFTEFLGTDEVTKSSEAAASLRERLREWADSKQLSGPERGGLFTDVYRFWQDNNGSRSGLSMRALANYLYSDEPDEFLDFMTDESEGIASELPAIKAANMRLFQRFIYKGSSLRLEFERTGEENWSSKIRVTESGAVTIRDAPDDLKEQLRYDA